MGRFRGAQVTMAPAEGRSSLRPPNAPAVTPLTSRRDGPLECGINVRDIKIKHRRQGLVRTLRLTNHQDRVPDAHLRMSLRHANLQ